MISTSNIKGQDKGKIESHDKHASVSNYRANVPVDSADIIYNMIELILTNCKACKKAS